MSEQPGLDGIPPLPPARKPGRPTKVAATEHAKMVRKAVLAGRPAARERGHAGAKRAADHADRVVDGWSEQACKHTLDYAKVVGSAGFLIEEARVYAEGLGFKGPSDKKAWGRIPKRLEKGEPGKRLEPCGYGPAISSNGSPKVKWRLA